MASLLDWAGGQIEGAFAQLNPFDNGADYGSVMRRRRQQEQAQQPVQRPVQPPRVGTTQQSQSPFGVGNAPRPTVPAVTASSMSQNSVVNRTKPQPQPKPFDPLKTIGDAARPISEGGINPFADAGKYVQKNVLPAAIDAVKHPEKIVSGIQQSAGGLGDIAVMGGNVLEDTAAAMRGASPQERMDIYNRYNAVRNNIKNAKTVTGESLNPQADFQWTGDAGKDFANLAGRGLRVGLDATSLINPTRLATGTLAKAPLRQTAKFTARDAGFFGAGEGVTAGAQNFAQTGDINQAVQAGTQAGIQTALGQGAFDAAGAAIGRATPVLRNAKTFGIEPPTNMSPNELMASQKVVAAQSNPVNPVEITAQDMQLYNQAQAKLGAQPGTPDGHMAVVDALNAHRNFDVQVEQRRQATLNALEKSSNTARQFVPGGTLDSPLGGKPVDVIQPMPVKTKPQVQPLEVESQPQVPARTPEQAVADYGGGDLAKTGGELEIPIPQKTSRYAGQTIPSSEYVGEQVSTQTQQNAPKYTPETERGRYEQTLRNADQQGFDNFENDVHERLQGEHIVSQDVADAQAVAQRLEVKGDDASLRRAADIYDKISEHLTRSGQTVQAAAIMSRRSPEGIKYQALKDLRKAGVVITPELHRKLNASVAQIAKTKPQTEARAKALGKLMQDVEKEIPQGMISNLVSTWKAGLLSGVKTTQGNIISNATFGALNRASNPVTLLADNAMAIITGKRTATGTLRGIVGGAKEGTEKGWHTLKTGVDLRTASDKYELHKGINFKNKIVQKYVGTPAQKVFDFMGSQDQPFYFSQMKNSLYDQAKAEGINHGFRGQRLKEFMEDRVANPSEPMVQRATDEAAKAVLGYDTPVSKAIQGAKQSIDTMPISNAGKQASIAVIDILAPFVRVPTAFLARTIDYTPLGIPKTAISQIANKKFDQRALSQAIGEGVTGTGVIVLGAALANSGDVSGDYPTEIKEQQRWKAEGIQPNSVKLGGKWVSLNYLGPVGMLLGAGKKFVDASKSGAGPIGATGVAIGGFGQSLLGQSFLQGLSGFIDAAQDPKRYLEGFVNGQAGSLVPSIVNDFGNLTDGYKRDVNNGVEALMGRVPGLRQNLNIKRDVYGNPITQDAASTLLAVKPSSQPTNDVIDEVGRLAKIDPNNDDLQVTPTQVQKTLTIGDNSVNLSDQQRYDLQSKAGQAIQDAWGKLIKTDEYKSLSDTEKAQALTNLRQDTAAVAQRQYVEQNNLGTYTKALTGKQKNIVNGSSSIASYARSGEAGDTVTISDKISPDSKKTLQAYNDLSTEDRDKLFRGQNDAEYKYNLAKFENDKVQNKLSTAEKIKAQRSIHKDKIGSSFSKEVRELYGLSKDDIAAYLAENDGKTDKNKLGEELKAYDRALYDSGATSSMKYKYGFASAGKGGGKGRGRKGSGEADGKAYVNLVSSLNKIRPPRTTGSMPLRSGGTPQLKKVPLRRYSVKSATISKKKDTKIKTSKA